MIIQTSPPGRWTIENGSLTPFESNRNLYIPSTLGLSGNIQLGTASDMYNASGEGIFASVGDASVITMTNRTGQTLVGSEAVVIDANNNDSVVFASLLSDTKRVCGIVKTGAANLQPVKIKFIGKANAISNGAIARGDIIIVSNNTPFGRVITDNTPTYNGFAKALSTTTGAGSPVLLLLSMGIG